jgi:hypothetical protein
MSPYCTRLNKKDIGKREAKRRGGDSDNPNYLHSLSITERVLIHPDFADVLEHFLPLGAEQGLPFANL